MTIKEIAALAGVSASTVSKIMNGKDGNINPTTRSRVLKIAKEHHYEPYSTIKNVTAPRKFLIGLLLNSFDSANGIIDGVLETAQKHGYQLLIFNSNHSMQQELKHITALCNSKVDGVIWEPVNVQSAEYERFFSRQSIPVCYLNFPEHIPSYSIDFAKAGYELTQELLHHKHTHIACLLQKDDPLSEMVLDGFQKCLYDHKISFQEHQLLYAPVPDCYPSIIAQEITGVVSAHYPDALALYEQLENLHYYVPASLSLVSLCKSEESNHYPYISCIPIPYYAFGSHVCELLIKQCEKSSPDSLQSPFVPEYAFMHKKSIHIPSFLRPKRLVVAGSIHMDLTFIVDHLPQAGKTTEIITSLVSVGGKGVNQSVGASKLGCEVSLIGKLGNDFDSSVILNTLKKEHVSAHGIYRDKNVPTGKAYIYTGEDGESTITVLPGANQNLTPEDIHKQQHLFDNAGFCLLSTEIPTNTVTEAARIAHQNGVKVILKPAVLRAISDELLALTDIFIPNQKEAAALCPHKASVEEQAEYFLKKGAAAVIITLGHKGCYLRTQKENLFFPAENFAPIDTTGGADAFICALASYLTEGYPLCKAIRIASFAAGFCVSRQGVVSALVDRSTLETYIAQHDPTLLSKVYI